MHWWSRTGGSDGDKDDIHSSNSNSTPMTANTCSNNIIVLWICRNVCHVALNSISMCENDWQNSRRKMKTETGSRKNLLGIFRITWFVHSFALLAFILFHLIYCANKVWRLYENICASFNSRFPFRTCSLFAQFQYSERNAKLSKV